jgi:hypothetical protein
VCSLQGLQVPQKHTLAFVVKLPDQSPWSGMCMLLDGILHEDGMGQAALQGREGVSPLKDMWERLERSMIVLHGEPNSHRKSTSCQACGGKGCSWLPAVRLMLSTTGTNYLNR